MTFAEKVKKGRLLHPTQLKFDLNAWQAVFFASDNPSERDKAIYSAGVWIFNKLEAVRQELSDKEATTLKREKLLRSLVGEVNRTAFILQHSHIQVEGNIVFGEQLIQGKYNKNYYGIDYTPDQILTGVIDGIRFPIRHALRQQEIHTRSCPKDEEVLGQIMAMIILGNYYSDLENIWLEVLWNGWTIVEQPDFDLIIPPKEYVAHIVTDYRRQGLLLQFFIIAASGWNKMSANLRRKAAFRPKVTITGSGKKRRYTLSYHDEIDQIPVTFVAKVLANEFYFSDVLSTPLPKYNNRTLEDMLLIWEMLHSLAGALQSKFPSSTEVNTLGKLYEFSPGVNYNKLLQLVQELLDVSIAEANNIIDIFILKGKEELWFRPLIKINEDTVLPLMAPILSPNLLRIVEHWMKEGGFPMASRGDLFEEQIHSDILSSIHENAILKNCRIVPKGYKFKSINEQIDLVIILGSKILLGEAKCGVFPASPIEISYYYKDLEEAPRCFKWVA